METIRILFYTDYSFISENRHFWGLTDARQFIQNKLAGIANVDIQIKNRHFDYQNARPNVNGATRLTRDLLSNYDELWVFGVAQQNTCSEPYNELLKEEVEELRCWMNQGGVLITGDHSSPKSSHENCDDNHASFLNLGRALGRSIPRAGELRVWDGPPTGCYEGELAKRDNFNTQEGSDPLSLDNPTLQVDGNALDLRLYPTGTPHRLFWWYLDETTQKIKPILKFPDHLHEGKLEIPTQLGSDWPKKSPLPLVVAQGQDNRFVAEERFYDLVVAYDGDSVGVGRIVADSSFHHYININLLGLPQRQPNGNPQPGSDLDQIAQYYANLAYWLAPKDLRTKIKRSVLFRVASHPEVLEIKGGSPFNLGKTGRYALELEIGASNLHRLLVPSTLEEAPPDIIDFMLYQILLSKQEFLEIKPEVVLGFVIKEYHNFFDKKGIGDPGWLDNDPTEPEIALNAVLNVFQTKMGPLEALFTQFRESRQHL